MRRRSIICTLHQCLCQQIKEDEGSGHVTYMGENRNAYKIYLEKPEEMKALEIILKWILKK
jgi:hypothetical protein